MGFLNHQQYFGDKTKSFLSFSGKCLWHRFVTHVNVNNIQKIDIIEIKLCKSWNDSSHSLKICSLLPPKKFNHESYLPPKKIEKKILPWTLAPSSLVGHVHDCNARPATVESHFLRKKNARKESTKIRQSEKKCPIARGQSETETPYLYLPNDAKFLLFQKLLLFFCLRAFFGFGTFWGTWTSHHGADKHLKRRNFPSKKRNFPPKKR